LHLHFGGSGALGQALHGPRRAHRPPPPHRRRRLHPQPRPLRAPLQLHHLNEIDPKR
jgi:hypothetical protein